MIEYTSLRLADIADVVNGFAFPIEHQGGVNGIPFFKVGDMNTAGNEETLTLANNTVSVEVIKALKLKIYPVGTIVFPKVGGALLTNKKRVLGIPGTFDNNVMGVIPTEVSGEWLRLWFEQFDLASIANVQALPSIRKSDVEKLLISVPPSEEQDRVAKSTKELLCDTQRARDSARKRVGAVVSLGSSYLRNIFNDVVPISIGVPLQSAPSGWRWIRLTDLAQLESGHTPSRKRPDWWGGEIPWIALPDIRKLDGLVAHDTLEKTNALGIANSSARILPVNTVVLSRTASVGYVTILGREMATSQDFVNFIGGPELESRFLLHALRASRDYLVANASGAIHRTLYMPAVKDFHICLPDLSEQRRVADVLDESLTAQKTLLEASRRELAAIEALPAAILRTVFTDAA